MYSQPAAYPIVGQAPYAAAVPPGYAEAADAQFAQGYQYERSGRFYEAEQIYERIIMQYPSASSALLANARLNYLRDRTRQQGVRLAASTTAAGAGLPPVVAPRSTSGRVVAVNSPYPSSAMLPSTTVSRENPDIIRESAALYKTVCSRPGVFESKSGWPSTAMASGKSPGGSWASLSGCTSKTRMRAPGGPSVVPSGTKSRWLTGSKSAPVGKFKYFLPRGAKAKPLPMSVRPSE